MRALKVIGFIFLLLVVSILIIVMLLPDTAHMERKIVINRTPHRVYQELISFRNYEQWWPWALKDSGVESVRSGAELGVGAMFKWKNNNPDVGMGFAEIVKVSKDSLVLYKMGFHGYQGNPRASLILRPVKEGTEVTWAYDEVDIAGLAKIFVLGIDGFLGGNYEAGLKGLKKRVEAAPLLKCRIDPEISASFHYLGIQDTTMDDPVMISIRMAQHYGELVTYLYQHAIEPTGAPIAVLTGYSDSDLTFTCGIPVPASIGTLSNDDLTVYKMDSMLVLRAQYSGSYEGLEKAHLEIHKFAGFHDYQLLGNPWEEYLSDPGSVPDTSEWQTNIYYPVK